MVLRTCALVVLLAHCGGSKAATPPPVALPSPAASVVASAEPAPATSAAPPAPKSTTTKVVAHRFEDAASLPSGEVLVATAGEVLVWDPRTSNVRRTDVAGAKFLHSGSTRFAVARGNDDASTLELWDASTLAAVEPLEGNFAGQSFGATSADGRRFLYGACKGVSKDLVWNDCAIAVYAVPEGRLVHRTVLAHQFLAEYMLVPHLSPSGTYFALSHGRLPTRVYESATGKLALQVTDARESSHARFLDDRRVLTSTASGKRLEVTDLATGKRLGGVDFAPADSVDGETVSPDTKRVAMIVTRKTPASHELAVWSVDRPTASRHPVPAEACPEYCEVVWRSEHEIVVRPSTATPKSRFRFDVEADKGTAEPDEDLPIFTAGPFRVSGGFSVSTYLGRAELGPNPHDKTEDGGSVTIDGGAPVPLPKLRSNDTALSFDGERLVVVGSRVVYVVTKDGVVAELVNGR